jgi:hypothetical protein
VLTVTRLDRLAGWPSSNARSRAHTGEGRERAKGVKMGRKPKLTDHQRRKDHGEETLAEIRRSYNVSGWTIGRLTV